MPIQPSRPEMPVEAVAVINVFTPKTGQMAAFIAMQLAVLPAFRDELPGLRGSGLYRAIDGNRAVQISVWDTAEAFEQFRQSEMLAGHRARIAPLLDHADPALYEQLYSAGCLAGVRNEAA